MSYINSFGFSVAASVKDAVLLIACFVFSGLKGVSFAQPITELREQFKYPVPSITDTSYTFVIVNPQGNLYSLTDSTVRQEGNYHVKVHDINFKSNDSFEANVYVTSPIVHNSERKLPLLIFQHWGEGDKNQFLSEAISYSQSGFICLLPNAPWLSRNSPFTSFAKHGYFIYRQGAVTALQGMSILLEKYPVDTEKVYFVGHSFGAGIGAILSGIDHRIKSFVLMGGIQSLTRTLDTSTSPEITGWRERSPEAFKQWLNWMRPLDAELYIPYKKVPVLMQFATNDEFVNNENNRAYGAIVPEPARIIYYDAKHDFNEKANRDRELWIKNQMPLK